MRKAARVIWFFIILFAACGAAFYYGYSPLKIPHDSVGVLVSKTSGVSEKPIEAGSFQWNWELLIPTNAKIRTFSNKNYTYSKLKAGTLPGADVYSKQIPENPSFGFSAQFDIELKVNAAQCVALVKENSIFSDSDLQKKYSETAEEIVSASVDAIISQAETLSKVDVEAVKEQIYRKFRGNNIEIVNLSITNVLVPDFTMYQACKNMYLRYMATIDQKLQVQAELQAKQISEYNSNLNKLEKFAKVLKDHPELAEFLKSSKDMNETLKTIYSFN